jgi:hypothetical protein
VLHRHHTSLPTRFLAQQYGNRTFAEVLPRLRCRKCFQKPAPVYLCEGQRTTGKGGQGAGWAIELVPEPGSG